MHKLQIRIKPKIQASTLGLSKAYRNKGTILYDTRSVDWNNFKKTFMRELKQIKNVKKNRGERKEL